MRLVGMQVTMEHANVRTLRLCFAPAACPSSVSRLVQVTLHTLHVQGARADRKFVPQGSPVCCVPRHVSTILSQLPGSRACMRLHLRHGWAIVTS